MWTNPYDAGSAAPLLWPTGARCGRLGGQHLARSRPVRHILETMPLPRDEEERPPIDAPEHAREAAAVEFDGLEHFTPFADAHAPLVRDVRVPDGAVRVDANAVGGAVTEVGPHAPVRQATV